MEVDYYVGPLLACAVMIRSGTLGVWIDEERVGPEEGGHIGPENIQRRAG